MLGYDAQNANGSQMATLIGGATGASPAGILLQQRLAAQDAARYLKILNV